MADTEKVELEENLLTDVEAKSSKLVVSEDEDELELGLSSAETSGEDSFEQERSAETEVGKAQKEAEEEVQPQKEVISGDADLLIFADSLLKLLGRKKEKGKDRIKWNGEIAGLKDFVTLVLKHEGAWKCRTDNGKDIHTFNEKNGKCTITWWSSNGTLNTQGPESKHTTEKIEKIITKMDKDQNYAAIFQEASKAVTKKKEKTSTPKKKRPLKTVDQNMQEQINNIWSAVNELKERMVKTFTTGSMDTPSTTERNIIEINEASNKEANNEEQLKPKKIFITDYFKPKETVHDEKKEKQVAKKLNQKITELETEIVKLKEENNRLKTELYSKKQTNKVTKAGKPELNKNNEKRSNGKVPEKTKKNIEERVDPAQSNAKMGNVEREPRGKPLIIVAGDSLVKGLKGWMMSRRANVKVFSFSGSTVADMEHFIKPLIKRQPRHILLHIGTNDLLSSSPEEITTAIKKLAELITSHGIRCVVSEITFRDDDLWEKAKDVNVLMKKTLPCEVIDNSSISERHLNSSGLHLNQRGSGALAYNFISYIKSVDLN